MNSSKQDNVCVHFFFGGGGGGLCLFVRSIKRFNKKKKAARLIEIMHSGCPRITTEFGPFVIKVLQAYGAQCCSLKKRKRKPLA